MKTEELTHYDNLLVEVKMADGSRKVGRFMVTPERGLYHVMRDPQRSREIVGGMLEDLWAPQITSIKRIG